jgi:hypothetical protein
VSIAQAAHDHVNVDDFSALAQATVADHSEAPLTSNVSSTAILMPRGSSDDGHSKSARKEPEQ